MYFPFAYGAVKGVGNIAKYGKGLALSSSKINNYLNKVASAVRPTSDKPTAMFLANFKAELLFFKSNSIDPKKV